ncbi:MAG: citryl-CoA lyase [Nitrospinae bacterium]|nr:citryl-CoA lyase [Nitrospinota bacterium]
MSEVIENKRPVSWRTAITKNEDGDIHIRGYNLEDMISSLSFPAAIFLVLKGELPSDAEEKMMNAIFVSCIDAGIAPPSVGAARKVFSGGNSFNSSVAAGIMSFGDYHGGAIEQSAKFLLELLEGKDTSNIPQLAEETVRTYLAEKKRFLGLGHKIHTVDPRTTRLINVAEKAGFGGKHLTFMLEVAKQYKIQKPEKNLPLNVDGAIAAIICDMGFDWKLGKAFFIIARTPGLCAHIHEEWSREKPFRRLEHNQHIYDGVDDRKLDK